MNLELTESERELMLELLQSRWNELKQEMHHARVSSFKDQLKATEACLQSLLDKLQAVHA
jgi:hypothetical protein